MAGSSCVPTSNYKKVNFNSGTDTRNQIIDFILSDKFMVQIMEAIWMQYEASSSTRWVDLMRIKKILDDTFVNSVSWHYYFDGE